MHTISKLFRSVLAISFKFAPEKGERGKWKSTENVSIKTWRKQITTKVYLYVCRFSFIYAEFLDSEVIKVDEYHLIDFNCILCHIEINVFKNEAVKVLQHLVIVRPQNKENAYSVNIEYQQRAGIAWCLPKPFSICRLNILRLVPLLSRTPYRRSTLLKKVIVFPSPAGMSQIKLSLAGNNLTISGQGDFC